MTIRTPRSYQHATWRNILSIDADGRIGMGFDPADGATIRVSLSLTDAVTLAEGIVYAMQHHSQTGEIAELVNRELIRLTSLINPLGNQLSEEDHPRPTSPLSES